MKPPVEMQCEIIEWEDFNRLCLRLAEDILNSGFQADMIIAIDRGGAMPARMLSDMLNINDFASFRIIHYQAQQIESQARIKYPLSAPVDERNILLVDDVSDTGDTFILGIDHINACGNPKTVRTVALHHKTIAMYKPHYYAEEVEQWRWLLYPWAVTEDIGAFLKKMDPSVTNIEEMEQLIKEKYGVQLPRQRLQNALSLLGWQPS